MSKISNSTYREETKKQNAWNEMKEVGPERDPGVRITTRTGIICTPRALFKLC